MTTRRTVGLFTLVLFMAALAVGAQLRQVAMIDLPGRPGFEGVAFRDTNLLIVHKAENKLHVFDTAKRRVVARVEGLEAPTGVAVTKDRVFVANSGADNIAVISPQDWKVLENIPLNASPYELQASPDGNRLVASNWRDRSVTIVDLTSGYRQQTIELNGAPSHVAFAGESLCVTLQDHGEVAVIEPSGKIRSIKLAASQPTGIAASASGERIFVAVRFAVIAIDPVTGSEVGRVAAPAGVDSLWLDAATGILFAGSSGAITVIRTKGEFSAEDEIRADVKGQSLAFDPAKGLVYVPGGREGRSKLLILRNVQAQPLLQPREVANK